MRLSRLLKHYDCYVMLLAVIAYLCSNLVSRIYICVYIVYNFVVLAYLLFVAYLLSFYRQLCLK